MKEFTHVVPIGSNCRNTLNIRRFFDFSDGYPFDWWTSPLCGLVSYFETGLDIDVLYDPSSLQELRDSQGQIISIRSQSFGFIFDHEFERDPAFFVRPNWSDHIVEPRSRQKYLTEKLLATNAPGNSILFVRSYFEGDKAEDLERLAGLTDRLFSRADVAFLSVNYSTRGPFENILTNDLAVEGWQGVFQNWRRALVATGYQLVNDRRSRFKPLGSDGGFDIEKELRALTVR
jgi:hypothetical protein